MLNNDYYERQQRERIVQMERPPVLGSMSGRLMVCLVGTVVWGYVFYMLFASLRQPLLAVASNQPGFMRWYDIAGRLFILLSCFVVFGACSWLGWTSIFKIIRNTLIMLFVVALVSLFGAAVLAVLSLG